MHQSIAPTVKIHATDAIYKVLKLHHPGFHPGLYATDEEILVVTETCPTLLGQARTGWRVAVLIKEGWFNVVQDDIKLESLGEAL